MTYTPWYADTLSPPAQDAANTLTDTRENLIAAACHLVAAEYEQTGDYPARVDALDKAAKELAKHL